MKRSLTLFAALLGFLVMTQAPAQAHNTEDWYWSTTTPTHDNSRDSRSNYRGATQKTKIYWERNSVAVRSSVSDDKPDGYCAIAQIRYEIYDDGVGWSGHWHYRAPVVDCSTDGRSAVSKYAYGKPGMRHLSARACLGSADGVISTCESTWH
ncbi:hypothetical protein [Streptomyces sp. AC550_RSS872]|uniref:hypothetical protein n=1 Tax=Streptomyces sp. AC550_RSS872 TaxID=2823689 RepID=UPI001C27701D|nr:hypothetical protein [Streptomyces sp. AC550_RSS872]